MSYDGIEVDMLNLGNADSILVTQWSAGVASRILIDGGNTSNAEKVLSFLSSRGIKYLNHIVCSHPHDDHAGGLLGVVKVRTLILDKHGLCSHGNTLIRVCLQQP